MRGFHRPLLLKANVGAIVLVGISCTASQPCLRLKGLRCFVCFSFVPVSLISTVSGKAVNSAFNYRDFKISAKDDSDILLRLHS